MQIVFIMLADQVTHGFVCCANLGFALANTAVSWRGHKGEDNSCIWAQHNL